MAARNGFGVSRRGFVGGIAGAVGTLSIASPSALWAKVRGTYALQPQQRGPEEYDLLAKLGNNENPYGPPESVMKAMTQAFKYSNRYGYPDGGIVAEIAKHHGVKPENILLGAGSGEILDVVGSTYAANGKKVVGVEPSFSQVYSHVTSVKGAAITIPLTADYHRTCRRSFARRSATIAKSDSSISAIRTIRRAWSCPSRTSNNCSMACRRTCRC
jgi:aspartate/methionine/tyrosine aminotransferase